MPTLPQPSQIRSHVFSALARYWPAGGIPINALPLQVIQPQPAISPPLRLQQVAVPHWAAEAAVEGQLLVPREAIPAHTQDSGDTWRSVDWLLATFLLLEGWHERLWEHEHGPIHSYSLFLSSWDQRAWQHAWVNRIGLFLRQWAIQRDGLIAEHQMGALSEAEIRMTHDVDALRKTLPIRFKQGAFNIYNGCRALRRGQFAKAVQCLYQAKHFLFGQEDWWVFDRVLALEQQARIHAVYHFYADTRPKDLKRWLLDPGYSIEELAHSCLLQQLKQLGHYIGLHPGFDTWQNASQLDAARDQLERAADCTVKHVRQHWLRFSWRETWSVQASAGLNFDTTLMFNDRPGYRTSSALAWQPWNPTSTAAHPLTALPTVLMDSHFYDYQPMSADQRRQSIQNWIGECKAVRGQVAVLWHPHTLSPDYGWSQGFNDIIASFVENRV